MKMELIAKSSGGGDRPLPPAGMQHGVLYSVIDLGTQKREGRYGTKIQRMVNVAWELPHLPKLEYEDDGKKIFRPQCIFKTYTLSLFKKANLAKDLAGWRGSGFTKAEENGFNIFSMLKPNANALLQVVHYEGNDGSTKAKYESISPLMSGMIEILPENKPVQYSTELHDEFPDGMPEWTIEAIKSSPEYKGIAHARETMGDAPIEDTTDYTGGDTDVSGFPSDTGDKDDISF